MAFAKELGSILSGVDCQKILLIALRYSYYGHWYPIAIYFRLYGRGWTGRTIFAPETRGRGISNLPGGCN